MSNLFRASAAAVLLGGLAFAQSPQDLLNKAKSDQNLVTQRLEGKLREAVADAMRLQATSPVRAANALRAAKTQLDDPLVPPAFKTEWTTRLDAQIRVLESGQKLPAADDTNNAKRQIREADKAKIKALQDEYTEVKRSIDTIAALVKSGNDPQAKKEIEALGKRYPDNPAAIAMQENIGMNQRLADARFMVEQQKQGYMLAMRSVLKSAIPPKDDIEFDKKHWEEITRLRNKPTLTKKEQELLKALDSPINLGYNGAPFDEVLKAISNALGQNILIDKISLQQAMIESSTPVTVNLRGVAVRTALRKVLQDNGLTYVIRDETIQVVTVEQARSMLVTKVYYLGDLIRGVGAFGGGAAALEFGPQADFLQMMDNGNKIVEMIKTIDPLSWKDQGGPGTIAFNLPSMSVIVRQTAEMQARLGSALGR